MVRVWASVRPRGCCAGCPSADNKHVDLDIAVPFHAPDAEIGHPPTRV